jgi:hypothetical protein
MAEFGSFVTESADRWRIVFIQHMVLVPASGNTAAALPLLVAFPPSRHTQILNHACHYTDGNCERALRKSGAIWHPFRNVLKNSHVTPIKR